MTNLDMSTKELVHTYSFNNIYSNRAAQKESVIKGRTVIELGTKTATSFVGNLYRVFDRSVKSFKYLLLVGVAKQNPDMFNQDFVITEEDAEEVAALNAILNPVLSYVIDEPFKDDYFIDLCIVMDEMMPLTFVMTPEECGLKVINC